MIGREPIIGPLILLLLTASPAAAFNLPADAILERAEIARSTLRLFNKLPESITSNGPDRYIVRLGACRFPALIRATPFTGKAPPGIPVFEVLIGPPDC